VLKKNSIAIGLLVMRMFNKIQKKSNKKNISSEKNILKQIKFSRFSYEKSFEKK
jgi:hypothetical protein